MINQQQRSSLEHRLREGLKDKIQMPKTLIADIYTGYREQEMEDPTPMPPTPEAQPADIAAEAPDDIEAAAV